MFEQKPSMRTARRALVALPLFLAIALAGCSGTQPEADGHGHGHDEDEGALPFTGNEDQVIEVAAGSPEEFRFSPAGPQVRAGSTVGVIYTNEGDLEHDISIPEVGFHLLAQPGETVKAAFVAPDEDAEILCTIPGHAQAGMKGTLEVSP